MSLSESKRRVHDAAIKRAAEHPEFTEALGITLLAGFAAIEQSERYSGRALNHVYRCELPDLAGDSWVLTLERVKDASEHHD